MKSDLQYICHLDHQDFSESFLAHLGTCDTFIAGTCNLKALAESLFVDFKCLLQQNKKSAAHFAAELANIAKR